LPYITNIPVTNLKYHASIFIYDFFIYSTLLQQNFYHQRSTFSLIQMIDNKYKLPFNIMIYPKKNEGDKCDNINSHEALSLYLLCLCPFIVFLAMYHQQFITTFLLIIANFLTKQTPVIILSLQVHHILHQTRPRLHLH